MNLQGTKCKVNGKECYVAFIDRNSGITIKSMTGEEAICLNKAELLALADRVESDDGQEVYDQLFSRIVSDITNTGEANCFWVIASERTHQLKCTFEQPALRRIRSRNLTHMECPYG